MSHERDERVCDVALQEGARDLPPALFSNDGPLILHSGIALP